MTSRSRIRYKLDVSTTGVVGVCREPGCDVRCLSSDKLAAARARDAHQEVCHMTRGKR